VPGVEYSFNYCIVPLNGRSLLADSQIPQLIHDPEWMTPSTSFHRCGVALGYCALITTISVYDFALFGKAYLTVVNRCCGRFELANEAVLCIQLTVKLVAEIGFAALLCPRAIRASARLRFLSSRLICLRMPCLGSAVINVASWTTPCFASLPDPEHQAVVGVPPILPGLYRSSPTALLSEFPDGRKIGDIRWKSEKLDEREPIRSLPLEFRIGEPVPLLEHEQLDHYHLIDIWPPALFALVIVHITHNRAKRSPIYHRFYLCQPITKPFHPLACTPLLSRSPLMFS